MIHIRKSTAKHLNMCEKLYSHLRAKVAEEFLMSVHKGNKFMTERVMLRSDFKEWWTGRWTIEENRFINYECSFFDRQERFSGFITAALLSDRNKYKYVDFFKTMNLYAH